MDDNQRSGIKRKAYKDSGFNYRGSEQYSIRMLEDSAGSSIKNSSNIGELDACGVAKKIKIERSNEEYQDNDLHVNEVNHETMGIAIKTESNEEFIDERSSIFSNESNQQFIDGSRSTIFQNSHNEMNDESDSSSTSNELSFGYNENEIECFNNEATCEDAILNSDEQSNICNNNHEVKQSVEKLPYQCKYCLKKLKSPRLLLLHTRTHLEVKIFYCSQCYRGFPRQNDLQVHMKTHLEAKAFNVTPKPINPPISAPKTTTLATPTPKKSRTVPAASAATQPIATTMSTLIGKQTAPRITTLKATKDSAPSKMQELLARLQELTYQKHNLENQKQRAYQQLNQVERQLKNVDSQLENEECWEFCFAPPALLPQIQELCTNRQRGQQMRCKRIIKDQTYEIDISRNNVVRVRRLIAPE